MSLLSAIMRPLRSSLTVQSLTSSIPIIVPESISVTSIRTKVRCYFPRPKEVKRVRTQGWEARMSTPNGRKIIMRRLLKGKYVLTH